MEKVEITLKELIRGTVYAKHPSVRPIIYHYTSRKMSERVKFPSCGRNIMLLGSGYTEIDPVRPLLSVTATVKCPTG
jgi:hypothetical protein